MQRALKLRIRRGASLAAAVSAALAAASATSATTGGDHRHGGAAGDVAAGDADLGGRFYGGHDGAQGPRDSRGRRVGDAESRHQGIPRQRQRFAHLSDPRYCGRRRRARRAIFRYVHRRRLHAAHDRSVHERHGYRAHRSAARPAGHSVRPQQHGRRNPRVLEATRAGVRELHPADCRRLRSPGRERNGQRAVRRQRVLPRARRIVEPGRLRSARHARARRRRGYARATAARRRA